MNTTIRNRAAALSLAAVAGLAGVALTGGTALAANDSPADSGSNAEVSAAVAAHSDGDPRNASGYADALVTAWGAGSDAEVSEYATPGVVEALTEHGDEHATQWDRIAADGAADSSSVVYKNKATGELLTFDVDNEAATHGDHPAVHHVRFKDRTQPSH
ncbi:hypothetical protein SAMN04489751_0425 [Brevibacterium sandarakinum]|uniref:Peptidase propeptide and YPEB domain-containing protein n=1 Tax=Brevibacterium sandarakinum TaxID=629680 RepID=A0A1H1LTP9_BRESA|nr:hypothetical protein [Brevibacterium sandarakinum]SDR77994.1 hypothetical protein SAMN04489751_0425 [Brevibacterium sandarakinum]